MLPENSIPIPPKIRSKQFRTAWAKGFRAGWANKPLTENPYRHNRIHAKTGKPTWGSFYRIHWLNGWHFGDRARRQNVAAESVRATLRDAREAAEGVRAGRAPEGGE